jgi:GT2 family glycosyltransferase
MGEVYFLSEQLRLKGLKIFYDSEIVIHHYDHATCDNISNKKMWQLTKNSYQLYKKFL